MPQTADDSTQKKKKLSSFMKLDAQIFFKRMVKSIS